jgi:hypothetical protein
VTDTPSPTRQRFYVEDVACFVEQFLADQPPAERAKWGHLPAQLRAHPYPFFFVSPSSRIVDLGKRPAVSPLPRETDPITYTIED